jgi:hypothetical protein
MGDILLQGVQSQDWKEAPDSPSWDWAESNSCTRTFTGDYAQLFSLVMQVGYMGYVIPSADPVPELRGLRVKSAKLQKRPGGRGQLSLTYQARPIDTPKEGQPETEQKPPDPEYTIGGDKIERPIEDNLRYRTLIRSDAGDMIMTAIRGLLTETTESGREGVANNAYVLPGDDEVYEPLANELYLKMKRGFSHYVCYPPTVSRKSFSAEPPSTLNLGGYRENPPVPDGLALPTGEWLRQADRLSWNGTWWQLDQTWLGAEEWDHEIYPEPSTPPPGAVM